MKKNNALQEFLSVRFRRLLSGAPDGVPPWLDVVAAGDDAGYFSPSDAPWVVHGDFSTLVGGIRALILQALHPATLAGVSQHSRYESDPLGRLSGTIRWLTVTTFGSVEAVQKEASRVNRLHDRINGSFVDQQGNQNSYSARDETLLAWVHLAFSYAFVSAHIDVGSREMPGGPDAYVESWRKAAAPLGLAPESLPTSLEGLELAMLAYAERGELRCDEQTRQVLAFIENPPLGWFASKIYRLLFRAAIASLPQWALELTGYAVEQPRRALMTAKRLLAFMRFAIGPESPIEEAALERLRRIGALN